MKHASTRNNLIFVFDLDDTLYDQFDVFKNVINNKYNLTVEQIKQFYVDFRDYSDKLFDDSENGIISKQEMHCKRLILAAEKNRIEMTNIQACAIQEKYSKAQSKITIDENIKEILLFCLNNGIDLVLLTNGPYEHQLKKIKQLQLTKYFNNKNIIISGEVGCAKPNPNIFLKCEQLFEGEDCDFYMIGDSYLNDICGAIQNGWSAIWLNKYEKLNTQQLSISYMVSDTAKLYESVKEIYEKHKRN